MEARAVLEKIEGEGRAGGPLAAQAAVPTNLRDSDKWWLVETACYEGHVHVLHALGNYLGDSIVIAHDQYLLELACYNGHLPVVEMMVDLHGWSLHWHGFAGLYQACTGGHLNIVKFLLDRGGSRINIHDGDDQAMVSSVASGHLHVARFLAQLDPTPGAWPVDCMRTLQAWSTPRDAWMRSVVSVT